MFVTVKGYEQSGKTQLELCKNAVYQGLEVFNVNMDFKV